MTSYAQDSTVILSFVNSANSDQSTDVECETVSLDESKKFKIININQATNLDGPENIFEHKAQLIEIDKLLENNTANGPKPSSTSSGSGVWHQVSSLSFSFSGPPLAEKFVVSRFYSCSHLMNTALPSEELAKYVARRAKKFHFPLMLSASL